MKKIIIFVVVSFLAINLVQVTVDSGLFRAASPSLDFEHCEQISGPIGTEDISIDPVRRLAYISADDRRGIFLDKNLKSYPNGGIWVQDLSAPDKPVRQLKLDIEGTFHPHGLALRFSDEAGNDGRAVELYVVNHFDMKRHEIDVFTILPSGELTLRRRITYPELISPNDIAVAGKDQFFVSNDHGNPRHTVMEVVEDYMGLPLASVSYFDGEASHMVLEGLRYTNGLALSKDLQTLYVAETAKRQVSRYQQGESLIDWQLKDNIKLGIGVDNLEWDGEGNLLTAGHPKIFDFIAHMKDGDKLAASEVVRIDVSKETMSAETIYVNPGDAISGSSVAAQFEQQMLIGAVFDPHFLHCQMAL